jgi:signal peptidase I
MVVFNFPEGDTLLNQQRTESYYSFKRNYNPDASQKGFRTSFKNVTRRPSYIKRVMGLPGDSLHITNGVLWVNGKVQPFNEATIRKYNAIGGNGDSILNALNIVPYNQYQYKKTILYEFSINVINQHPKLSEYFEPFVLEKNSQDPNIFPHEYTFRYNNDQIGPLIIPKKGIPIELTPKNIALYARLIDVYEENKLEITNGQILINGKKSNSYTPKMNYYWVMGDNQPHSYDSRYWGFLPENHIIGVSRWHYHVKKKKRVM